MAIGLLSADLVAKGVDFVAIAATATRTCATVTLVGATAPADPVDGLGEDRTRDTAGFATDRDMHRAALEEEGEKKKRKNLGHDDLRSLHQENQGASIYILAHLIEKSIFRALSCRVVQYPLAT